MQEPESNKQSDFMIEKIKERPVNKKKLVRRTIITAAMAVIFGLIACFTFLVLEPVISNFLYPEEEPQIVVFPEDKEEMSPEEMLSDNMQQENLANQSQEPVVSEGLDKEQIQEIISNNRLSKDNYRQLYYAMSEYVKELNKYMVTVTGVRSNIDWFNNVEQSSYQSYGVIIAENGKELLILTDYTPLSDAESMTLTFFNGVQIEAHLKEKDVTTNLAVITVDLEELGKKMPMENVHIAVLGSSNLDSIVGTPVMALGNPMGVGNSIGYGIVTATERQQKEADTNYMLLQTDIVGSQNAGGVLFNLHGQVIGMITNDWNVADMKSMITVYGISDLKKRVENMSNGKRTAYLGISGVDVTKEANEQLNVPLGAYITEVEMDSPSMLAGIQQGDVLVSIDEKMVYSYNEYTMILTQLEIGQTVEVTVMRQAQDEYKEMKFDIVLEER